jgi:molecular chaperone IbpA
MRSFDFAPLYRTTVGFDRLFNALDNAVRPDWPPYNIEKNSENEYRITMAIAGYKSEEIELTQHGAELIVTGQKKAEQDERQLLHRGLAIGNFKQVFELADHVKVVNAILENGLLSVDLVREIPEELKPRRINIGGAGSAETHTMKQINQSNDPQRKAA